MPGLESQFGELLGIIARLRGPGGCPWDRAQTLESMRSCLLEECWEVLDTINRRDLAHLREELGDLLLNILLLCDIAESSSTASSGAPFLDGVLAELCDKLVRRHPHVFGSATAANEQEAMANWQKAKESESQNGELASVNAGQAALLYALKLQKRAARAGFDWPPETAEERISAKIQEELAEFRHELQENQNPGSPNERLEEELGDLLFSVVNLARVYKINPELALARSSEKFRSRFAYMERSLAENNQQEQEALWQQAKEFTRLP